MLWLLLHILCPVHPPCPGAQVWEPPGLMEPDWHRQASVPTGGCKAPPWPGPCSLSAHPLASGPHSRILEAQDPELRGWVQLPHRETLAPLWHGVTQTGFSHLHSQPPEKSFQPQLLKGGPQHSPHPQPGGSQCGPRALPDSRWTEGHRQVPQPEGGQQCGWRFWKLGDP